MYWVLCLVFKVPGQEDCQRPWGEMVHDEWTLPGSESSANSLGGIEMPGEVEDYEKKSSEQGVHVNVV